MRSLILYIGFSLVVAGCQHATAEKTRPVFELVAAADTIARPEPPRTDTIRNYADLEFIKVERLNAAPGTKSVLFNATGSRLYAMNLEGMSIYEFDQPSRKVLREFRFKPTRGTGWDYEKDKPIPSYQEKPVEACLTHNDRILWVSLHNAGGIVPLRLDSLTANSGNAHDSGSKKITVIYPGNSQKDSFYVPLIHTGKTPKVIAKTADNRHLLVSNWHSYNVSILETDEAVYPFAKVIGKVPVSSIPRGIAVDDRGHRSFVAIMGGAAITVINNSVWMRETDLPVESNPRHIVMDTSGHLFLSYNKLAKIACINVETGKTLYTAATHSQPRTIILSKNHKFLFVTCYNSDIVDVFKVKNDRFEKIASLPCKGHPVGVDVFEDNDRLEAWVCSYSNGSISVFSFNKK